MPNDLDVFSGSSTPTFCFFEYAPDPPLFGPIPEEVLIVELNLFMPIVFSRWVIKLFLDLAAYISALSDDLSWSYCSSVDSR